MSKKYSHYKASNNNNRTLEEHVNSDKILLECEKCSNKWSSTKRTYTVTPTCKKCEQVEKSVISTHPAILDYTSENLTEYRSKSDKLTTFSCPKCKTWFQKTIKTFSKEIDNKINPCGKCNPRHRVKNGIIFLKNYPQYAQNLITPLKNRDDIAVNTTEKFTWLKKCGHEHYQTPGNFLNNPEKCSNCIHPYKNLIQEECTKCKKLIELSRTDKKLLFKSSNNFLCKECRENERIQNNSLTGEIRSWEKIKWSEKNETKPQEYSRNSAKRVLWECLENRHTFERYIYASNDNCPRCEGSSLEDEIEKMLENYQGTIVRNTYAIIPPLELDFYFPKEKIAIEVNGLYWHSDTISTNKNQHLEKLKKCEENGIKLLTLWEDDIRLKHRIVERSLKNKLGISKDTKYHARKTVIKRIHSKEAREFLNNNHIQGFANASLHYALKNNDKNVAIMSILIQGTTANIVRYATSGTVRGGFSKLLKHFLKNSSNIETIKTFSDNCISEGKLYQENGFKKDIELPPDYSYLIDRKRVHKFNYRINRFKKDDKLSYKEGLSETQLAKINNIPRIWDCGKVRWIMKVDKTT